MNQLFTRISFFYNYWIRYKYNLRCIFFNFYIYKNLQYLINANLENIKKKGS